MKRRTLQCDVLVVGAGVAGVSAAVGAARCGARTVLVGDESGPGGVAVAGMHRSMCGLFPTGDVPPTRTLNEGLAQEVFRSLETRNATTVVERVGRVYVLPFRTEDLIETLRSLIAAEGRLEVRFDTKVIAAEMDGDRIRSVVVADAQGEIDIMLESIVDCSGDGGALRMAGARCQTTPAEELQLAGQSILVEAVDDTDEMLRVKVPYHLAAGVSAGELPLHLRFTQYVPGERPGTGYLKLSVPPAMDDRERRAREDAGRVHDFLQRELPAFRDSRVVRRSPRVVDREGQRIFGEYTLTEQDVLSARKFADGAVKSAWPIELWDQKAGLRFRYVPQGDHYEIPLRCLKVAEVRNAWAAGRCISATHRAHASTRAMGTCLSLGEHAGRAAARALAERRRSAGSRPTS